MKRLKRTIATVTILVMIFGMVGISALAATKFTDIEGHWAKDYIEKMAEKGIISGYLDNTFKPSQNISKVSTIVTLYKIVKASDKLGDLDITDTVEKYKSVMVSNDIPTWAYESVAFALEKDIVDQSELSSFIVDGVQQNATRSEVAIYFGKTLNLYLKQDLGSKIYNLDFNDAFKISKDALPYIELLKNNEILSGDAQGNFNPDQYIQRAAVAKMLSISYEILEDLELEEETIIDEETEDEEKTLDIREGKIDLVEDDINVIRVIYDNYEKETYLVNDEVEISINDIDSDLDDLVVGANVKLYFENDKLIKIVTDDAESFEEGEVYSIIDMDSYYLITLKNENNKKRTFKMKATAKVEIDGEREDAEELEKGQSIEEIEIDGEYIESISVENDERVYEGIIETPVTFGEYPKIVIKTYGQKTLEFEVDEDADVEKNDKNRSLQSLTKGDLVTLYTEDNIVVKITAVSIEEDDEGVIREIVISDYPKITIENDNDELITYDLDNDADIEIDDEDAEIYDLRLGYRVDLEIESGTIKGLEAEAIDTSSSITGIITEIYEDNEAIIVEVRDYSGNKEKLSVDADDAKIYDTDNDRISFDDLDEDDEVLIFGEKDTGIFNYIAERILIIKEN